MEPFYFDDSQRQLFGVFHPPQVERTPSIGLVMCYPAGQEYLYSHRAYVLLGKLLASAGVAVLRFDYYGCGDSAGKSDECSTAQWCNDISTAIDQLVDGYEPQRLYLLGSRMGGTLAAIAGAKRSDIDGIVLWDPIVDGSAHINELITIHNRWLSSAFAEARPGYGREVLGFPLTDLLMEEIKSTNLMDTTGKPARNVLLVESRNTNANGKLAKHLASQGACVARKCFPEEEPWNSESGPTMTRQVFDCIDTWIRETL